MMKKRDTVVYNICNTIMVSFPAANAASVPHLSCYSQHMSSVEVDAIHGIGP